MSDSVPRYRPPGRFLMMASVILLLCVLTFLYGDRLVPPPSGLNATPSPGTTSTQSGPQAGARGHLSAYPFTRLLPTNWPFDPFGLGEYGLSNSAAGDDAFSEIGERSHTVLPQRVRMNSVSALLALASRNQWVRPAGLYPVFASRWRAFVPPPATRPFSSAEWGYLLPVAYSGEPDPRATSPLRLTMPPLYVETLASLWGDDVIGGVDYNDPSEIGTPLLWARGYEELQISPHFKVRDFATRDGAPLVRISPRLVAALERLTERAGPIYVISGYRHAVHNARVGGAFRSRHISGEAADIWSPYSTSLLLAQHVVKSMGWGIGLGLGPSSLHVDVRGSLTTWTYPGAPLDKFTLNLWIKALCSDASSDPAWLAARVDWMVEDSLEIDNRAELEEDPGSWMRDVHQELAAFAAASWSEQGPGAVVIDTLSGVPAEERALEEIATYVQIQAWEVLQSDIHALIDEIAEEDSLESFVYVALRDDRSLAYGLLDYERETGDTGLEPAEQDVTSNWGWTLVVASTPDSTEANTLAAGFQRTFAETGLQVVPRPDSSASPIRYLITVGHFPTAFDAREARQAHARIFPRNTWLMPVGR